jgi:hypothetical protein
MSKRQAILSPHLDEVSYGYHVYCYHGEDMVHRRFFARRDDAEDFRDQWQRGSWWDQFTFHGIRKTPESQLKNSG